MTRISEQEFVRLARGIAEDADIIFRHNPRKSREESLLWMFLSVLIMYLNLDDAEMPCFPNAPTAETYLESIKYIVRRHALEPFNADVYLTELLTK